MALALSDFQVPAGRVSLAVGIVPVAATIPSNGDLHASNPIVPTAGSVAVENGWAAARARRIGTSGIRLWGDSSPTSSSTWGSSGAYPAAWMHIQTEADGVATHTPGTQGASYSNWSRSEGSAAVVAGITGGGEFLLAFSAPAPAPQTADLTVEAAAGAAAAEALPEAASVPTDIAAVVAAGSPSADAVPEGVLLGVELAVSAGTGSPEAAIAPEAASVPTDIAVEVAARGPEVSLGVGSDIQVVDLMVEAVAGAASAEVLPEAALPSPVVAAVRPGARVEIVARGAIPVSTGLLPLLPRAVDTLAPVRSRSRTVHSRPVHAVADRRQR